MKKNNKAFTLVELLAVLIILALVMGIAVTAYYGYYENAKEKVFENYENSMKAAATEYIMETGDMPTTGRPLRLTLKYLVGEKDNGKQLKKGYIDYFNNPDKGANKCLDGSYVEVSVATRQANTDGKIDNNKKFEYKVCLICSNYRTSGC